MQGLLSISGLASGLDTDALIKKIMDFESRGVQRVQARVKDQQTILDAYGNFESRLLALKSDFESLTTAATFRAKAATSTDETVLTASASSTAGTGTFTITVDQLAQSHQVASQGFTSPTDVIGTGTFSLTVGKRSRADIAIDQNNNTLQGLVDAINNANAGASASLINTGDASTPYRVLITGTDTGAAERVVVDSTLSGGLAPAFGSVAAVVDGAKSGTSMVSSAGGYTGNTSGTMTYTVRTGGMVGVDNIVIDYTDGAGTSGSFTVAAGYTPGDTVDVFGGVHLAFSAGSLANNDTFSTAVTSSTLQAPADARFTLGSGAAGIQLTSSSNRVTNVVDGLTLDLHKVDANPVTIAVNNDTKQIETDVGQLVTQYNAFVDMMDQLFFVETNPNKVDTTKPQAVGALLGDRAAIDMYSEIQRKITDVTQGVDPIVSSLADIGATVNQKGKIALDTSVLDKVLSDDPERVFRLFGTSGTTTDGNVRFLGASSDTVAYTVTSSYPDGYAIDITQAAEKATLAGTQIAAPTTSTPIVVNSSNSSFKVSLGSSSTSELTVTEGVYESGGALASEMQDKINADGSLGTDQVIVRWVDDGGGNGHMEFQSAAYGSSASVGLDSTVGGSIYSSIGHLTATVAYGKDVHGTINGETATGSGQILKGDKGNSFTDGLQVLVSISAADLATQGSAQGLVRVTKGIASLQRDALDRMTNISTGDIKNRKDAVNAKITSLQDQIKRMNSRLDAERERLLSEFRGMEEAIANLQNQQGLLQQGLAALPSAPTGLGLGQ